MSEETLALKMSSDSLSVSSDISDPSDVEEAGDSKIVSNVGELKVVDIPSGAHETASSDEQSDRSEEQLSDQSDQSDFKSPRDQKRKTKSQKVRLKDGTVVDLTPPEKLLKKAEAKAKFLETKNKPEEAMKEYMRCTALSRLVYGDGHWMLASSHVNLAYAYLRLRGLAQQAVHHAEIARTLLLSGLHTSDSQQIKEKLYSTLQLMYYVFGRAYTVLKKYSEAEQNFAKAEKITSERGRASSREKRKEAKEMNIQISVAMAKLYANQNKHALGQSYFEKAITLIEENHGKESLQLIPVYQDLGKLEQSKGKHANHDQAVEAFLQAHQIAVEKYSGQSEEVADTAHKLALAYSESATAEAETAAERYLEESLGIHQVLHGPHHPKTLAVQDDICRLLLRTDRTDEATTTLKALISAKIATFGEWSEEVGDTYKLFGSIQMSQGQLEKALKNFKKCHSIQCNLYGASHRKSKATQNTIDMLLQSPNLAAKEGQTKAGQLKSRPRFNATIASAPAGGPKTSMDY